MRIVSLVPSITATIADLELENFLVGMTSYCVYPAYLRRLVKTVGGTKDADLDLIRDLKPTHILCNYEENTKELVEQCKKIAATMVCFPKNVDESITFMRDLCEFLNQPEHLLVGHSRALLEAVRGKSFIERDFYYFIWKDPWMVAGLDSYISNALELFGFRNKVLESRYPEVDIERLVANLDHPTLMLFASEPYPFRRRDVESFNRNPHLRFMKVDGQMLSWWGSFSHRLLHLAHAWSPDFGQCPDIFVPIFR
jgi:iron complex transport system substrate-binding protein